MVHKGEQDNPAEHREQRNRLSADRHTAISFDRTAAMSPATPRSAEQRVLPVKSSHRDSLPIFAGVLPLGLSTYSSGVDAFTQLRATADV